MKDFKKLNAQEIINPKDLENLNLNDIVGN